MNYTNERRKLLMTEHLLTAYHIMFEKNPYQPFILKTDGNNWYLEKPSCRSVELKDEVLYFSEFDFGSKVKQ